MTGKDGLDMDALEAQPEPPKAPEGPGKPEKEKPERMSDEDKGKVLGMAATIVCVAGLAVFVGMQLMTGARDAADRPSAVQEQEAQATERPSVSVELDVQPGNASAGKAFDPFNRQPGTAQAGTEPAESGTEGAPASDVAAPGGASYWIHDGHGTKMYRSTVPAGYEAYDFEGCLTVRKSGADASVTGDDPLEFYWKNDTETKGLLAYGYYDRLSSGGTEGFSEYGSRAVGYYSFTDADGLEWPVVTALFSRVPSDGDSGGLSYSEYRIIVGKPTEDGRYLSGSIDASAIGNICSLAYPDITAMAKALFPPGSGAPTEFPDDWEWAHGPDGGTEPQPVEGGGDQEGNGGDAGSNGYWDESGTWVPYGGAPEEGQDGSY